MNLLELTPRQLTEAVRSLGEKPYRAKQLAEWVYGKGVTDPAGMSNVPNRLAASFEVLTSNVLTKAVSRDGTVKLLIGLADGERIEAVLIPSGKRATACVSTQVGCAMGCGFCATGRHGFVRNLSSGEILQQVLHLWRETATRPTHVVFMGMGEPLANYEATVSAVRALVDPERFGLSARKVTVSTIGLPKQIRRLAKEGLAITLAISLHAPNDALRKRIVPAAATVPLEEVLKAAETFYEARKREVTLEYTLLPGANDTKVCADALARLAGRLRCNVNLIRYNPVGDLPYRRPTTEETEAFAERLRRHGVNVQVRASRGLDAEAACGQLRRRVDRP